MNSENLAKIYIIEIKIFRSFWVARSRKNAGAKNEGKLGDVIENKWIKNVRLGALRDIDEYKRVAASLSRC